MSAWLLISFKADCFTAWPSQHMTLSHAAQTAAPYEECTHEGCAVKLYYLKAVAEAERIVHCMSEAALLNALARACSTVLQASLHAVVAGVR